MTFRQPLNLAMLNVRPIRRSRFPDSMKKLIHEIHRRSLWQVLDIYLVGGWIALQAVDTLQATLRLPEWTPSQSPWGE
jgi:hypothetical protein